MDTIIKPGLFGVNVAADTRRSLFDTHNEELLIQNVSIDAVFIGDSITELWALDAYFRTSPGLLVNRGIGGDRTPYIHRRFVADALQLRPQLVVIMAGINNSWDLDNWDGTLARTPQAIEDEIVADLAEMVKVTHEQQIEIAVCSILPTNIPLNSNTEKRNVLIKHINERLRHEAMELGAIFVDYHQHFVAKDGLTLREGLADDGVHPRAVGYKIMADVLLKALSHDQHAILSAREA